MNSICLFAISGGADIFNDSYEASRRISEGWTPLWQTIITPESGVYAALCRVGVVFALGSLIVWSVNLMTASQHSGTFAIEELIWPLIVIAFLAGDGLFLARTTLLMRSLINNTNQIFLENASAQISLEESYQEAIYHDVATAQIGGLIKQCQALTGQQQVNCLKQAAAQAKEIIEIYDLKNNALDELVERMDQAQQEKAGDGALAWVFAPFQAVAGAAQQAVARFFLLSFQISFQQTLEGTLLLTALLGPLAVGGSLLPMASRSMVAWITVFFSAGMAKLCYNIMVGFTAVVVTQADASDGMTFLLTSAFTAPALSLALAGGGGMAIWGAISEAQAGAADMVGSAVSMVVLRRLK